MKKKDVKPKRTQNKEHEDLRELNSQLGSFGLEPPKIYRKDQKINDYSKPKAPAKTKRNAPKNAQEQRKVQNKKRRLKKKVRRALYGILMFAGIALVIVILSLTVLFKINTITITGNEIYNKKEISAVLPIQTETNLFLADTKGAKEKLEENLPYIYNAEIKRKLPSTITVTITETPRVYSIKNRDKTYTLLDDNFKVLEANVEKKPKNTVEIRKAALLSATVGKKAEFTNKKTEKNLKTISETVKKLNIDKITGIYSNDINNNFVIYENRITIKLGEIDNIEDSLYEALAVIEKLNESNPQAEGELTVSSGKQIYFTEK